MRHPKSKQGLYNDLVHITRKSGQGIPHFVIEKGGWEDIIESLIEDGLVHHHTTYYSSLPNDKVYLIKGVYNVEVDSDNNKFAYSFMRHYLGVPEETDGVLPLNIDVVNHNMEKYKEFVLENLEGLEAIKNLKEITLNDSFSEEEIEFIKTRKYYEDNMSIKDSIPELEERNELEDEYILNLEKILRMMGDKPSYEEEVKKHKKDLEKSKTDFKYRKKIINIVSCHKEDSDSFKEVFDNLFEKLEQGKDD